MSTQQIVWTVVFLVAALIVIGVIVMAAQKKKREQDRHRAAEIRDEARQSATGIPESQAKAQEAQARAREAEAKAEQARVQAERAGEHAQTAQQEVVQQEATREDKLRAADRIDPDVDHKAGDYSPGSAPASGDLGTDAPAANQDGSAVTPARTTAAPAASDGGLIDPETDPAIDPATDPSTDPRIDYSETDGDNGRGPDRV